MLQSVRDIQRDKSSSEFTIERKRPKILNPNGVAKNTLSFTGKINTYAEELFGDEEKLEDIKEGRRRRRPRAKPLGGENIQSRLWRED